MATMDEIEELLKNSDEDTLQTITQFLNKVVLSVEMVKEDPQIYMHLLKANLRASQVTYKNFKQKKGYIISPEYAILIQTGYLTDVLTEDIIRNGNIEGLKEKDRQDVLDLFNAQFQAIESIRQLDKERGGNLDMMFTKMETLSPPPMEDDFIRTDKMFESSLMEVFKKQ